MSPEKHTVREIQSKPRVGIPWRTRQEELAGNLEKLNYYSRPFNAPAANRSRFRWDCPKRN